MDQRFLRALFNLRGYESGNGHDYGDEKTLGGVNKRTRPIGFGHVGNARGSGQAIAYRHKWTFVKLIAWRYSWLVG